MKSLLLTGPPGVGKTTLIEKVCEHLTKTGMKLSGFYTEELRVAKQRIGFDVVCLNGQRSPLARAATNIRGPKVGKYTVNVSAFESAVLPLLSVNGDKPSVYVIDEIGKMELFSDRFKRKVTSLFDNDNCVILGTIPVTRGNGIPFIESLKGRVDVMILDVTLQNRDTLLHEIVEMILSNFQDP